MSDTLTNLRTLFRQLEDWDKQARRPSTARLTAPPSSDDTDEPPLTRNINDYQALTNGIRELAATSADDDVLYFLIECLRHPNSVVRLQAISVLGYTGRAAAVYPLANLMQNDSSFDVKAAVAQSLGLLQSRFATETLVEVLQSEMLHPGEAKVRFACAQALSFIADPNAVAPLFSAFTRDYGAFEPRVSDLREALRDALVSIGSEAVVDQLVMLWQKPKLHPIDSVDGLMRLEMIIAFGQIEKPRALDFLLTLARHNNPVIREAVMSSLAYHHDDRSLQSLNDGLTDADAAVRESAEFSLRRLGKPPKL